MVPTGSKRSVARQPARRRHDRLSRHPGCGDDACDRCSVRTMCRLGWSTLEAGASRKRIASPRWRPNWRSSARRVAPAPTGSRSPRSPRSAAAAIDTYDDHRMAMSFALAAIGGAGVTINDPGCVGKTFPALFRRALPGITLERAMNATGVAAGRRDRRTGRLRQGNDRRSASRARSDSATSTAARCTGWSRCSTSRRSGIAENDAEPLAASPPRWLRCSSSGKRVEHGRPRRHATTCAARRWRRWRRASPSIRPCASALLARQRAFRRPPGLVADGRDMGTVVFPGAPLKLFLTASAEARAERRYKQLIEKGISVTIDGLLREIRDRDTRDSARAVAPLAAGRRRGDRHDVDVHRRGRTHRRSRRHRRGALYSGRH